MGYFSVRYDSRVVIYERKMFIRLTTDLLWPNRNRDRGWSFDRKRKKLIFVSVWFSFSVALYLLNRCQNSFYNFPVLTSCTNECPIQRILTEGKGVSLYSWPTVYFVWIQLLCLYWMKNSFGQIQTSQAGGQPYSNTPPYGDCSLPHPRLSHLK